jgi:hypothetical protein
MAKKKAAEPAVRKSFIVGGGIVIGVAILGFVLSTFVLGGGGGGDEDTGPVTTPAPVSSANPGTVPGSDGVPTTDTDTSKFPANELKPGGRNPFNAQAKGSAPTSFAAASAGSADVTKAVKPVTAHTWQMLELADGKATILVDGKKKIVSVGDPLVGDYKFNSITGKCVTVKGSTTFGLCPGAAPFIQ